MDVFFQQEGAVGPLLFSLSLIASLLLLLTPYLIWKVVARLKQNGEKLQEINDRLATLLETLAPEATLSPLTDQNEPSEQNQVPFNFEESEVASAGENPESEIELNSATDSTPPTDADDDLFEFDIPDHFDSTNNTEFFDSIETKERTDGSDSIKESDIGEAFDLTDDLTDGNTVDESDDLAPTETTAPSDSIDDEENLGNSFDFEKSEEFDLSEAFDPMDDLNTADDFNLTKEQSDDIEFATPDLQKDATAASLSTDTDFGKDIDATEFASGPDNEFAFEFDEELGELTEADPISLNDTTPLSFDETPTNFTGEEFESEEASFTFETEDDSKSQSLDEFPDIDFTEDASIDFDTSDFETDKDQDKPSLDEFPETDFTATADRDNDNDNDDSETASDVKDQRRGLSESTVDSESFVAPTTEIINEEDPEDFAAAFDEIEPALSSESLDDIAASILKDQETPTPAEIEPTPSEEIKPEPIQKIVPEPPPIPEISPVSDPAPKPATLFARCEGCNHKLAYKETLSGKRVRCPACSVAFKLP